MDLDEDRIGVVMVRASELRAKIANCIHKSTNETAHLEQQWNNKGPLERQIEEERNGNFDRTSSVGAVREYVDDDEEAEILLNLCDAFESLESQLASLQALQQQQQYEREAAIGEIEYSRKILLEKLKEYQGEHLDVIKEASTFASMEVGHDSELRLPPYQSHLPQSLVLDNGHLSRFLTAQKLSSNGVDLRKDLKNNFSEPGRGQGCSRGNPAWRGLRFLVGSAAKTMVTLVGVLSILSLAGFEPKVKKDGMEFNILGLFGKRTDEERRGIVPGICPPGRVAVREDGELRCIVKERVEIPFDSVSAKPNVNYGCG